MTKTTKERRHAMKLWQVGMDLRGLAPATRTQHKHLIRSLKELEHEGEVHSVEETVSRAIVFLVRLENELKAPMATKLQKSF